MNGDGARAGLKQVIAERNQADLGASGLGRLLISAPTRPSVRVAEDVGLAVRAQARRRDLELDRRHGDAVRAAGGLHGRSRRRQSERRRHHPIPLHAARRLDREPHADRHELGQLGPNEFAIGATSDGTAANLQAALTTAIGGSPAARWRPPRRAASGDASSPIRRSASPARPSIPQPPSSPARADSLIWYTGETGIDPARSTASVRIDTSITVSYGMRANEEGIRYLLQNVAAIAAIVARRSQRDRPQRRAP